MRIKITKIPSKSNVKALGGDIQNHGSDWSTGMVHIDEGGTHSENPNEGVQVGVDPEGKPNLVEEGEVIFNDYVYSNRIELDDEAKERFHFSKKQDITYADAAKKLEREASERPNDPISTSALKIQMAKLAEEQERQKQEMQAEEAREAFAQLSPEEQVAVMQQIQAQQQGQGQPSPEEQAMMEQQAMQEQGVGQPQMSPEEQAMMEQQMAMQGGGQPMMGGAPPMGIDAAMAQQAMAQQGMPQEAMMPQQPMMAYGGMLNKFYTGGLLRRIKKWISKNHPDVNSGTADIIASYIEGLIEKSNTKLKGDALDNQITALYEDAYKLYDRTYPNNDEDIINPVVDIPDVGSQGEITVAADANEPIPIDSAITSAQREAAAAIADANEQAAKVVVSQQTSQPTQQAAAASQQNNKGATTSSVQVSSNLQTPTELPITNQGNSEDFNKWWKKHFPEGGFNINSGTLLEYFIPGYSGEEGFEKAKEEIGKRFNKDLSIFKDFNYQKDIYNNAALNNRYNAKEDNLSGTNAGSAAATSTDAGPITLGANLNTEIMNALGLRTWEGLQNWIKENKVSDKYLNGKTWGTMTDEDWSKLLQDPTFMAAFAKGSPALAHALGLYNDPNVPPPTTTQVTVDNLFPVSSTGSWGNSTFKDWWGSGNEKEWDPMFAEVVQKLRNDGKTVDADYATTNKLSQADFNNMLKATDAYTKTTDWLKRDPKNMEMYLNAVLASEKSPEKAKAWARNWLTNGKLNSDATYDRIFGKEGGKREDNYPGTYWYSVRPDIYNQVSGADIIENYLRNKDGNWELMVTGVPEGWKPVNQYKWNTKGGTRAANYYVDPDAAAVAAETGNTSRRIAPKLNSEAARYVGLFGPLAGLGMMAAGIGKPTTDILSGIADEYARRGPALATMEPIGNYLKYVPQDFFTSANAATAAATGAARAMANAGGTAGSIQAANIANTRNLMSSIGDIHSKGQAANFDTNAKITAHNSEIDKANADAFDRLSQFNAGQLNEFNRGAATMRLQAAAQNQDALSNWYNSLYGNVGALFKGFSDYGLQKAQENMLARVIATGALGNGSPENAMFSGLVDYYDNLSDKEKRRLEKRGGLFGI